MADVYVPPTANFHVVPFCNYACVFCYDKFLSFSGKDVLTGDQRERLLRELALHGVEKVTVAGGEPTLHPQLAVILAQVAEAGLVPSLVTNGRVIDAAWFGRHGPHLRVLALSCDSIRDEVSDALGRRLRGRAGGHVAQVRSVFQDAHRWNSIRPAARRLVLKLNMVVTNLNVDEDVRPFLRECRPDRVKLLQLLPVAGENDEAAHLRCPDDAFARYAARVATLEAEGIRVVPEDNTDMTGSYLMIDPLGRLFQLRDGRYVTSRPVLDVGLRAALADVGGVDEVRFRDRGGAYDPGDVPRGNLPFLIALEGLDGSGKSTIARALADRLGGVVVQNPPPGWHAERTEADRADERARRAFYLRGNRAAMEQAAAARAEGRAVVMDRSCASTLAYGEATAGRVCGPDSWPTDIERPVDAPLGK